ncbi:hypothetical protein Syun_022303 [Stephania yunnanensis]|uniref:Transmembrane protein 53 n=1 Tax=Stephania yunnanensis TaxID=152371 RepID=A0AAP0FDM6_9MAGN
MGSLSGVLQRPLTAAAALAVAALSTELPDKLPPTRTSDQSLSADRLNSASSSAATGQSWASRICVSELTNWSFETRFRVPLPNWKHPVPSLSLPSMQNALSCPVAPVVSPAIIPLYQSAMSAKAPEMTGCKQSSLSSTSDALYRWHLPDPSAYKKARDSDCSAVKSKTVVVLLGWLGAKQKHLKRYADWYTSRGFHVITFTFPMSDVLSYRVGGKAEQHIDSLVDHLASWLEEENEKNLVFHTFSNTGWLTYGVVLERFQRQDPSLTTRIRGCVVDSAPVAAPDPKVWASGFSAAFLKKRSVATKGSAHSNISGTEVLASPIAAAEPMPAITETALLAILEKFFEVVLNIPQVNRRLSDVVSLLSSNQPKCPQLYIYSSADRVIPAEYVEVFIEKQRKAGHEVRACNCISTPHVDHFRNNPNLYSSQLNNFFKDCVLTCCKDSS